MDLTTETQLAEQFGIKPERAAELRNKHHWPHVRLGRFDVRYTEEQVRQIVDLHTERAVPQSGPAVTVSGQTSRSASRKKSA